MRVRRKLTSLCRSFRIRLGFRSFAISLAAVYFTAMYVFHSGLNMPTRPHNDQEPPHKWLVGGADAEIDGVKQQLQRRRPVDRLDRDRDAQDAFDRIRDMDQQQQRVSAGVHRSLSTPALSAEYSAANVPTSCNSTSQPGRQDDLRQLGANAFLLSAFWDQRTNDFDNQAGGTLIRVMAILRSSARPLLFCDFGFERTQLAIYEMCENHNRPFGSYILSCSVPDSVAMAPCFVKVVADSADSSVHVPVWTLEQKEPLQTFSVCVPPLFGDVAPEKLVEFFELTFILGADRIVIYDWKTEPQTRAVVQHYSARCRNQHDCRVEVIDWKLPDSVALFIWYNGQSIAIQDCLYRLMASSRYVVFGDIDEFIIPHRSQITNWSQLAASLTQPNSCAFQFTSAFFQPSPRDTTTNSSSLDGNRKQLKPDLLTLRSRRRSEHFSKIRTKCMVEPRKIFEAGIHHISKPILAQLTVERVDTELAVLHHYRSCMPMYGMNCAGTVEDNTIQQYAGELEHATARIWNEITKIL